MEEENHPTKIPEIKSELIKEWSLIISPKLREHGFKIIYNDLNDPFIFYNCSKIIY